jgi:hypothetical protein
MNLEYHESGQPKYYTLSFGLSPRNDLRFNDDIEFLFACSFKISELLFFF